MPRDFSSFQTAAISHTTYLIHAALIRDTEMEFQPPNEKEKEKLGKNGLRKEKEKNRIWASYAFNVTLWLLQIFPLWFV